MTENPVRFSESAEKDIENILQYTLQTWGTTQFEKYFALLTDTINAISRDPFDWRCKRCDALFTGCLARSFGRHIVYYRVKEMQVEIVRILHQQMDPDTNLSDNK